jgi:hypothetical protein
MFTVLTYTTSKYSVNICHYIQCVVNICKILNVQLQCGPLQANITSFSNVKEANTVIPRLTSNLGNKFFG